MALKPSWLDLLRRHPAQLDLGQRSPLEERNLLRAIVESVARGLYTTDLQGRIVSFNPAAERMSGRTADAVLGRYYVDALGLADEDGERFSAQALPLECCIDEKHPVDLPLAFLTRPDGERIPIALSTSPILDPLAAPAFCVAVMRDLTRDRELEQMKLDLASFVSHELRTPLGHIRGFTSTLLQQDVEWGRDTREEYLRDIEREVERLDRLITDVLDMTRMQAGLLDDLVLRAVPPRSVVEAALRTLRRTLEGREIIVDLAPDLPTANADCLLMVRVLSNLLENAAKYSPPGAPIRIAGEGGEGEVRIAVEDRGPGVPPDQLERIFEKFVRLDPPGRPRVPGVGLGLALCRAIVNAHGGRIWAEGRPDGGARFIVALPVAAEAAVECWA